MIITKLKTAITLAWICCILLIPTVNAAEPWERDIERANALFDLEGYELAENIYRDVLAGDSTVLPAYYGLAKIYDAQENHESALAVYRELYRRVPGNIAVLQKLSGIYLGQKKYDEAIPLYEEIVGQDDALAHKDILAQLYYQEQRYEEALPLLEKLVTAYPENRELDQRYRRSQLAAARQAAEKFYQQAEEALRAGEPETALKLFRQAQQAPGAPADVTQRIVVAERALFMHEVEPLHRSALSGDLQAAEELVQRLNEQERRGSEYFTEELQRMKVKILLRRAEISFNEEDFPAAYVTLSHLEDIIDAAVVAATRRSMIQRCIVARSLTW